MGFKNLFMFLMSERLATDSLNKILVSLLILKTNHGYERAKVYVGIQIATHLTEVPKTCVHWKIFVIWKRKLRVLHQLHDQKL